MARRRPTLRVFMTYLTRTDWRVTATIRAPRHDHSAFRAESARRDKLGAARLSRRVDDRTGSRSDRDAGARMVAVTRQSVRVRYVMKTLSVGLLLAIAGGLSMSPGQAGAPPPPQISVAGANPEPVAVDAGVASPRPSVVWRAGPMTATGIQCSESCCWSRCSRASTSAESTNLYDLRVVRSFARFVASSGLILLAGFFLLLLANRIAGGRFIRRGPLSVGLVLPLRTVSYAVNRRRQFLERVLILGASPWPAS